MIPFLILPYDSYIFVSRIDTADIVSFGDLEKHVVGITKHTKYFKEFEFAQDISKVLIKDIATGLKMLLLNKTSMNKKQPVSFRAYSVVLGMEIVKFLKLHR